MSLKKSTQRLISAHKKIAKDYPAPSNRKNIATNRKKMRASGQGKALRRDLLKN